MPRVSVRRGLVGLAVVAALVIGLWTLFGSTPEPIDPGEELVRRELMRYLQPPVVVFSKSYCPHSRRAKDLLLDMYTITPPPVVVELDLLNDPLPKPKSKSRLRKTLEGQAGDDAPVRYMGRELQNLLGEFTGRMTVPNIVVNGRHSIGGNDNIWKLHEEGQLAAEILKLGAGRVALVQEHGGSGQ